MAVGAAGSGRLYFFKRGRAVGNLRGSVRAAAVCSGYEQTSSSCVCETAPTVRDPLRFDFGAWFWVCCLAGHQSIGRDVPGRLSGDGGYDGDLLVCAVPLYVWRGMEVWAEAGCHFGFMRVSDCDYLFVSADGGYPVGVGI